MPPRGTASNDSRLGTSMLPYLLLGTTNGEGSYRMTVYEQFARQAALPAGKR